MCPKPRREAAWARIVRDLPMDKLDAMTSVVPLSELPELAGEILKGSTRGRVVVDTRA
jgi:acrylyl-CoA reductase (NADPH)